MKPPKENQCSADFLQNQDSDHQDQTAVVPAVPVEIVPAVTDLAGKNQSRTNSLAAYKASIYGFPLDR